MVALTMTSSKANKTTPLLPPESQTSPTSTGEKIQTKKTMKSSAFYLIFTAIFLVYGSVALLTRKGIQKSLENAGLRRNTTKAEDESLVNLVRHEHAGHGSGQYTHNFGENSFLSASGEHSGTDGHEHSGSYEGNKEGSAYIIHPETSTGEIHHKNFSKVSEVDTKIQSPEEKLGDLIQDENMTSRPETTTITPSYFMANSEENSPTKYSSKLATTPWRSTRIQTTDKFTNSQSSTKETSSIITSTITPNPTTESPSNSQEECKNEGKIVKKPTTFMAFIQQIKSELNDLKRWKYELQKQVELVVKTMATAFKVNQQVFHDTEVVERRLPDKRRLKRSMEDGFSEEILKRIEANFPCRDPKTMALISSGTTYFDQQECSQCQCYMGKLKCQKDINKCFPNACHLQNDEFVPNFAIHNDGCNNCLCSFGQLTCTHLRCPEAGHRYTNYKSLGLDNSELESDPNQHPERLIRGRSADNCLECDHVSGSDVCGRKQWKTYPTLCHALFCGENKEKDVVDGSCETLV